MNKFSFLLVEIFSFLSAHHALIRRISARVCKDHVHWNFPSSGKLPVLCIQIPFHCTSPLLSSFQNLAESLFDKTLRSQHIKFVMIILNKVFYIMKEKLKFSLVDYLGVRYANRKLIFGLMFFFTVTILTMY